MRNIFWLISGAAALYFFSKFSFGQKAGFFLRSIKPGGSLLSPVINVDMAVQNPTNSTITVKSITGSISVNDRYIANVSAFGDQKILPNQESIIKLTARPSAIGVFESVRELLTNPIGTSIANFQGTANVDGIVIPINESKTI